MRSLGKKVSAAWSFLAGTLLGALAVFVLLACFGIPGLKAEGSQRERQPMVATAGSVHLPTTRTSTDPEAQESGSGRPTAASREKEESLAPRARRVSPRHSELDLQLD